MGLFSNFQNTLQSLSGSRSATTPAVADWQKAGFRTPDDYKTAQYYGFQNQGQIDARRQQRASEAQMSPITVNQPGSKTKGPNPYAFQPQYLNGQLYSNANDLNQAQQDQLKATQDQQAQNANQPIQYQGQQYNNYHDYGQAVLKDITATHNQAVSQANKAYQDGLISFDEKQKAIDLSRQNAQTNYTQSLQSLGQTHGDTLANNSSYFSNISPYAYQSQQGSHEGLINNAYDQSVSNLGTQNKQNVDALNQNQADLANVKGNFQTDFTNNMGNLNKTYQGSLDQSANAETAYNAGQTQNAQANAQAMTNLIDQQKNLGLQAAANASRYAGQAAGKQVSYTPLDLLANSQAVYNQAAGFPGIDPRQAVGQYLGNSGLSPAQASPYVNYAYGGQPQTNQTNPILGYTSGNPGQ